jgi:hypothetical protein
VGVITRTSGAASPKNIPAFRIAINSKILVKSFINLPFCNFKYYLAPIFIISLIIVCTWRCLWKIHKGRILINVYCIPVINKIFKLLCLIIPVNFRISNKNKSRSVNTLKTVSIQKLIIIGNVNFLATDFYDVLYGTKSTNLPTICTLAPVIFHIFSLSIFLTRFPYSAFQAGLVWQRVVSLVTSQCGTELQPRRIFSRQYCN